MTAAGLRRGLREPKWGLLRARELASAIANDRRALPALVAELFGEEVEVRKRAADVARRVTEQMPEALAEYADELAGLLAGLPVEESRTRWHLGLVVPRVAVSHEQRLRAARLMMVLAEDESNVVRCSAVEGLAMLALTEDSLRGDAEEMVERYLRVGTKAMKSRARNWGRRLGSVKQ